MKIEARDIAVSYGGKPVLHGVDFTAAAGEMIGLIGPNGAGKTSLLRVLANLREPERGTIHYDGRTAAELGGAALARLVAYLAQNAQVHWPVVAEHLVALGRIPHLRPFQSISDKDRAAIARAMALADVTAFATRTLGEVSAGERMRILLARALAVEATVLLADEPIAALDPLHQLQVMELMRNTTRAGGTVVVVLHDLSLAARFCDRLVLLANGGVLAEGKPADVLTDDIVARAYGVEMLRGEKDGVAFMVPWKALDGGRPHA